MNTACRRATPLIITSLLACALGNGGGCALPKNDRIQLGDEPNGSVMLESFTRQEVKPAEGEPIGPPLVAVEPSVVDMDRTNWAPERALVPLDGTWHRREYSKHPDLAE